MSAYNVKCIQYKDSLQVRIYAKPIITNHKVKKSLSSNVWTEKEKPRTRTSFQIEHSAKVSVNRTVNQIYALSRSNRWTYFITLTIDPHKLNSMDYNLILDKLGIWVNNLKKRYAPDLQYLFVPELHKDKQKWHFHGLFSNVGQIPFAFSGKVCVGKFVYDYARKPYATKIYNLPLWKYGFSTATQIRDSTKAGSYITKYITKDLSRILANKHRFTASQNLEKPIEHVYHVDYDSLSKIMQNHLQHVDYVSSVRLPHAGQEISYLEFNHE